MRSTNTDILFYYFKFVLKKRVSQEDLHVAINSNKDPNSILSIKDTLSNFHIESDSMILDFEDLRELRRPFLAYTRKPGMEVIIVNKFKGDHIKVIDHKGKRYILNDKLFKEVWTGVVTVPTGDSFKQLRYLYYTQYIIPLILLFFVLGLFLYKHMNSGLSILLGVGILHVIGFLLTIPLLSKALGKNSTFSDKLCSDKQSTLQCNGLLDSSAAEFMMGIKWAEVGFVYFLANIILVLCYSMNTSFLEFQYMLSISSLLYTVYSILYQFIQKQWCLFCISIQVVLIIQFLLFHAILIDSVDLDSLSILWILNITYLIPFTLIILGYLYLRSFYQKAIHFDKMELYYILFKKNQQLFNQLLDKQPVLIQPDAVEKISFGNENAPYQITYVLNPFCSACSKSFLELSQLLSSFPNQLGLVIILKTGYPHASKNLEMSRILIQLYKNHPKELVLEKWVEWFMAGRLAYEDWRKKYFNQVPDFEEILNSHNEFCSVNLIQSTPSLFINHHKMPSIYSVKDLMHFFETKD